tara:strand:+ start:280 stop:966 length:687 start_codon:yes stop_codon:yes gene_type:complete
MGYAMRECGKCKRYLEFDNFSFNKNTKDGYNSQCKECVNTYHIERNIKLGKHKFVIPPPPNTKICSKCKGVLPTNNFGFSKANKNNVMTICKGCANEAVKVNRSKNPQTKEQIKLQNQRAKPKTLEWTKIRKVKLDWGVYKIEHIPTKRYYIGVGWINQRYIQHFIKLNHNNHPNILWQQHFNNYSNAEDWLLTIVKSWKKPILEGRKLEKELIIEGMKKENILNLRT